MSNTLSEITGEFLKTAARGAISDSNAVEQLIALANTYHETAGQGTNKIYQPQTL